MAGARAMKFAYCIAAHGQGDQLSRLLHHLLPSGSGDVAIVHLDAKSELWRHRNQLTRDWPKQAHVVTNPTAVHWGDATQVRATALMVRDAIGHGFDYAHHLSGVDWPIKTRADIERDIRDNGNGTAFMTILGPQQAERMQLRWINERRTVAHLPPRFRPAANMGIHRTNGVINALFARLPLERSQPYGPWQKGWSWWSLPAETAAKVADAMDAILASGRLRATMCCDEHVTATLVAALHHGPVSDYRREIRWLADRDNPEILTRADMPTLHASSAWFARKFDGAVDDFFYDSFGPFA
jgi:Core-2/I-Branching enzyme